tara:strand:+ start:1785 stop:2282 length:498 start_codon:yes stop_codon:yes gene_type:complete
VYINKRNIIFIDWLYMGDYNQSIETKKSELKCSRAIKKLCKNIFGDDRVKVHISTQSGAKIDMLVYNSQNCLNFCIETKEWKNREPTYISTKKIYNIKKFYNNNGLIVLLYKNLIYWADVSKIELTSDCVRDGCGGDPCYFFKEEELSTNLDNLDTYLRLKLIVL